MTQAIKTCMGIFESLGRARAAHHLHVMGYHDEARKIILGDQ